MTKNRYSEGASPLIVSTSYGMTKTGLHKAHERLAVGHPLTMLKRPPAKAGGFGHEMSATKVAIQAEVLLKVHKLKHTLN